MCRATLKRCTECDRFGFNGKENDREWEKLDFGARVYDSRIAKFLSVDPLAPKFAWATPYSFAANMPTTHIDNNGEFPWPVTVRSFISTPRTGGFFRGDGRTANVLPSSMWDNSSRVRSNFVVNPSEMMLGNRVTAPIAESDPTDLFIGELIGGRELQAFAPPITATATPLADINNINSLGEGNVSFDFSHEGKDPLTPSLFTPALDVNATLSITEDLANGILTITGSFIGDEFPSTEAFITDQSGTSLFLGARKETGGIHSLFGENGNVLFNINMQINFDDEGNFINVNDGNETFSVEEWNQRTHEDFEE